LCPLRAASRTLRFRFTFSLFSVLLDSNLDARPLLSSRSSVMDFSSVILTIYIICETIRADYTYFALHNYPDLTPSLIAFLSELLKLLISSVAILSTKSSFDAISKTIRAGDYNKVMPYSIPAVLYLSNNLIYFIVLPLTSPSILQVCVLAKLPATAIMHNFMIRRQTNRWAWTSLFCICVGLVIFNIPASGQSAAEAGNWLIAPVAGIAIAILSGLASIYGETLTKKGDFWESQSYLYLWGVVLALISFPLTSSISSRKDNESNVAETASFTAFVAAGTLVGLTAGVGLIVAVILRRGDNLLKMVGTSASLVTVAASQFVIMPELRKTNFTPLKIWGGGLVAVSTWCYNHYKEQPWRNRHEPVARGNNEEPLSLPDSFHNGEEDGMSPKEFVLSDSGSGSTDLSASEESTSTPWWVPDATKVLGVMILVSFAAAEVSRNTKGD